MEPAVRIVGKSLLEHWSAFVQRAGDDECWLWLAQRHTWGYGMFRHKTKSRYAHRVAWELFKGEIPAGMCVLHNCDNPPCCNPNHLFLGSPKDNSMDMVLKGRSTAGEKHRKAKLTLAQVEAIRTDPRNHHQVAKEYGVSYPHVSRIRSGHRWVARA